MRTSDKGDKTHRTMLGGAGTGHTATYCEGRRVRAERAVGRRKKGGARNWACGRPVAGGSCNNGGGGGGGGERRGRGEGEGSRVVHGWRRVRGEGWDCAQLHVPGASVWLGGSAG